MPSSSPSPALPNERKVQQVIPDDNVRDELWDAPLTQAQWNTVRWMFEDRNGAPTDD
jgi:hypothetical protein